MPWHPACSSTVARRHVADASSGVFMHRYLLTIGIAAFMFTAAPANGDPSPDATDGTIKTAPVAVQRVTVKPLPLRDEAAMVLIGTALIGLAAAVRRAAL